MEVRGKGGREGKAQGEQKTRERKGKRKTAKKRKKSRTTHNHTAVKTVKGGNMEVVRQVLSESVSGNWENGDHHWGADLRVTQQHRAGRQGPTQELQGLG